MSQPKSLFVDVDGVQVYRGETETANWLFAMKADYVRWLKSESRPIVNFALTIGVLPKGTFQRVTVNKEKVPALANVACAVLPKDTADGIGRIVVSAYVGGDPSDDTRHYDTSKLYFGLARGYADLLANGVKASSKIAKAALKDAGLASKAAPDGPLFARISAFIKKAGDVPSEVIYAAPLKPGRGKTTEALAVYLVKDDGSEERLIYHKDEKAFPVLARFSAPVAGMILQGFIGAKLVLRPDPDNIRIDAVTVKEAATIIDATAPPKAKRSRKPKPAPETGVVLNPEAPAGIPAMPVTESTEAPSAPPQ